MQEDTVIVAEASTMTEAEVRLYIETRLLAQVEQGNRIDTDAIRERYRDHPLRTDGRLITDAEHVIALCREVDALRRRLAAADPRGTQ